MTGYDWFGSNEKKGHERAKLDQPRECWGEVEWGIFYGITADTGARTEKSDVKLGHLSKRSSQRATLLKEGVPPKYPQPSSCPLSSRPTQPFLLSTRPYVPSTQLLVNSAQRAELGELKLWTAQYNSGRLPTQVECQLGLNVVNSGD